MTQMIMCIMNDDWILKLFFSETKSNYHQIENMYLVETLSIIKY